MGPEKAFFSILGERRDRKIILYIRIHIVFYSSRCSFRVKIVVKFYYWYKSISHLRPIEIKEVYLGQELSL